MLTQTAAFGLTLLIEAPIVIAVSATASRGLAWRVAAALFPSCVTHPFAWHAMGNFGTHDYGTGLLLVELLVVSIEMVLLRLLTGMPLRAILPLSIGANVASTLVGLILV